MNTNNHKHTYTQTHTHTHTLVYKQKNTKHANPFIIENQNLANPIEFRGLPGDPRIPPRDPMPTLAIF